MTHTPTPWAVNPSDRQEIVSTVQPYYIAHSDPGDDPDVGAQMKEQSIADCEHIVRCVNAHDELVEALREGVRDDRDPTTLRKLAARFADNAPITGDMKGAAAEIIAEYARFIRVARAALAKVEAP